jgi:hypothetical protein
MYDTTYIDLTTDTNIRLLVSIKRDGTMTVTDPNAPNAGVTVTFNDTDSTGCIGAALARSVASAAIARRDLDCHEYLDQYDIDLLAETVRDGISAILKGETGIPWHLVHTGHMLTACIIAQMTVDSEISDDAHRAFVNANNLTD